MTTPENEFCIACEKNDLEKIRQLLTFPSDVVTVDMVNDGFQTVCSSLRSETVELLLKDERVDVNRMEYGKYGYTPLMKVVKEYSIFSKNGSMYDLCIEKPLKLIKLLLKDPRLDIYKLDMEANFWSDSLIVNAIVIEKIAREPYYANFEPEEFITENSKAPQVLREIHPERIDTVIETVKNAQNSIEKINARRQEIKSEKAGTFATFFVMYTDDYLQYKKGSELTNNWKRILKIVGQFPLELQLLFAHRLVESMRKNVIPAQIETNVRQISRYYGK